MPDIITIFLTLLIGSTLGALLGVIIQRKLNKSNLTILESEIRNEFNEKEEARFSVYSNKYREKE